MTPNSGVDTGAANTAAQVTPRHVCARQGAWRESAVCLTVVVRQ